MRRKFYINGVQEDSAEDDKDSFSSALIPLGITESSQSVRTQITLIKGASVTWKTCMPKVLQPLLNAALPSGEFVKTNNLF